MKYTKRALLEQLLDEFQLLREDLHRMAVTIDDILTSVHKEQTVVDSVVALLNQLHGMLSAAGTDPTKVQAVLDLIATQQAAMAKAVVDNTPSVSVNPNPGP